MKENERGATNIPTADSDRLIPHIRWMIIADRPAVMAIELDVFDFPWREEDFACRLRQQNCIGMVAVLEREKLGEYIVGYMIYELHKHHLQLLSLAVQRDFWGHGIGTAMLDKLKKKLSPQRRRSICLEVRETNLSALLFLKSQEFQAVMLLRNWHAIAGARLTLAPDEDAIAMEYRI